jgi:hypothetical protein
MVRGSIFFVIDITIFLQVQMDGADVAILQRQLMICTIVYRRNSDEHKSTNGVCGTVRVKMSVIYIAYPEERSVTTLQLD